MFSVESPFYTNTGFEITALHFLNNSEKLLLFEGSRDFFLKCFQKFLMGHHFLVEWEDADRFSRVKQ
jgi:hypothetical protein